MNFNFDDKINNFLKIVAQYAYINGINLYFVGGIVRDNILNNTLSDIDLIVNSNAIDFAKTLPCSIKIKSIHQDFSTVKVEYDGLIIDIASTRTEHYPNSGCLPVVDKIGVKIEEDYQRRDFSINAMYVEIKLKNDKLKFNLIDLADGIKDIKNKTLCVLHNKSYIDDPTRILRGVDFKYRFKFDFSDNDKKLIKKYLDNPNLEFASNDRIEAVFKKVLLSKNQDKILTDIINNKYYKILGINNVDLDLKYINIINDFHLTTTQKADFYIKLLKNKDIEITKQKKLYNTFSVFRKLPIEHLAYYFYKTNDESVLKYLKNKDIKLFITGNDLLNMGFKQGEAIGEALCAIYNAKINSSADFSTKEDEINYLKNLYPET